MKNIDYNGRWRLWRRKKDQKRQRKPRKQPKVHVEVVGSWQDRPAYERFQHWKPHIENMYHMLGYGDVTVEPSQEMIDEYNAIQANKEKGA